MVTPSDIRLSAGVLDPVRELVISAMREPRAVPDTAASLVALAREHLAWDHAGITVHERNGTLRTVASTDPIVEQLDVLQHASGRGPALDCLDDGTGLVVADLATDLRWPQWRESATALGLHRVASARLADQAPRTVLNLYATTVRPLTTEDIDLARSFAHEASMALRVTGEVWHLHQAIAHRTVIGQAEGFLMEKYGMDAEQAIAVLKRISSQSNSKLHAVASEVVSTRQVTDPVRQDPAE